MKNFGTPSRNSKTTLTHNATYGCSCDRDRKRNEKAQAHRQPVVQEPKCRNTTETSTQKQQQTDEKEIVKHIIGITNKP